MAQLDWGRRFLMCPPAYFGVLYEINPWMHTDIRVDTDLAHQQWNNLVESIRQAGAEVELMQPAEGSPDLVFTANAGIVNGNQFVPTQFRYPERQAETPHDIEWFSSHGFQLDYLPSGVIHEGAGDALPFGLDSEKVLISGYNWRSQADSHAHLSRITGAAIRSVELVDPRLYHIDLCFTPLDDRRAIIAETAFDRHGARSLQQVVPEPLVLTEEEALSFCCNSVVIDNNIVMPACPPRIGRQLEAWGFNVIVAPVTEFMKGGGGCRCLTLALDVTVGVNGQLPTSVVS